MDNLAIKRIYEQAINCRNHNQSTRSAEGLRDQPICRRCDKPMRLLWRSNNTGTRQVWFCRKCILFRIVKLAEYTINPR